MGQVGTSPTDHILKEVFLMACELRRGYEKTHVAAEAGVDSVNDLSAFQGFF